MATEHHIRACLRRTCLIAVIAALATATVPTARGIPASALPSVVGGVDSSTAQVHGNTIVWKLHYEANGGNKRIAYLVLPRWYGPHRNPRVPLVISPHGVGPGPFDGSMRRWGDLPSVDRFAVVFPEGQGRYLAHYSWGYPGQIDDLARMPTIVRGALPWLRIDRKRIYAVGGSMGGQETMLLVAKHPRLLAGAVSFDAPGDMALRYQQYGVLEDGEFLRGLMRLEVGGPPEDDPGDYAARSPLDYAREIAFAGVPMQIWWSTRDRMVVDEQRHSGLLYREVEQLNPHAPVSQVVGTWEHGESMRWNSSLPDALRFLGLRANNR
jgi:pimeloyl-ACP methyl ester carboxylesterase